jgi:NAD(P)-dependent dehydrogenase (short-subunit alcohol dehydrogenase family)
MPANSPPQIADLSGQSVLVTGATSGVGRATATALAAAGAHVTLAVRNLAKGQQLADQLGSRAETRQLDLADLGSVRTFAERYQKPIDVLINNAGVSETTLKRTSDGFEMQMGTNHLGHFALTGLLLEQLHGRVVNVASQAERMARLDLDDLNWERRSYKAACAYNDSKLANLLFTAELNRRLKARGSSVTAMAAHPGLVDTAIYEDAARIWVLLNRLLAQDADKGAKPVLLAATADLPADSFTGPRHLMHMRGGATLIDRSKTARDAALARQLWNVSESLTGVHYAN